MNFFRYSAKDGNGLLVQGTVQAASPADVQRDLASKGYQLQQIEQLGSTQAAPRQPGSSARVMPEVQIQPPRYRSVSGAPPVTVNPQVRPLNNAAVVRTAKGTDKQRFFIFSQLAAAFRAGLNAANAFHEIGQRGAAQFAESLHYAAEATAEGISVSDVFARYPDLYPSSVVGLTRAGETAGFLPDAFDEIARQAETAHSFRRWFFWVWFLLLNFILSVPLMQVTVTAVKSDWDKLNAPGGTSVNPSSLFAGEMLRSLLWPWGPLTLVSYLALFAFNRWMAASSSEMFRHRLGLKMPIYGKRAWQENLARFSWTMARVSRAGISPARAWQLSADSVPNLAFRDSLREIGGKLQGSEKMSDLFFRSKLFPDEYAPMIATAEYTGDLPGALEMLSQVSAGEFMAAQNYVKARSGCWGLLFGFITSALLVGMLLKTLSVDIPRQIMQDTDEGK